MATDYTALPSILVFCYSLWIYTHNSFTVDLMSGLCKNVYKLNIGASQCAVLVLHLNIFVFVFGQSWFLLHRCRWMGPVNVLFRVNLLKQTKEVEIAFNSPKYSLTLLVCVYVLLLFVVRCMVFSSGEKREAMFRFCDSNVNFVVLTKQVKEPNDLYDLFNIWTFSQPHR